MRDVYAVGDAATSNCNKLHEHLEELWVQADVNGDLTLSKQEFVGVMKQCSRRSPQAAEYSNKASGRSR
jgi:hypothetical protein